MLSQYFDDKTDIELIKDNHIGPDEILVQLEGNTLQSKVARSVNFCNEYDALFQVPVAGRHNLKVVRLRRDFTAVRYDDKFPEMHYEVLLDEEIGNNLCSMTLPTDLTATAFSNQRSPLKCTHRDLAQPINFRKVMDFGSVKITTF